MFPPTPSPVLVLPASGAHPQAILGLQSSSLRPFSHTHTCTHMLERCNTAIQQLWNSLYNDIQTTTTTTFLHVFVVVVVCCFAKSKIPQEKSNNLCVISTPSSVRLIPSLSVQFPTCRPTWSNLLEYKDPLSL